MNELIKAFLATHDLVPAVVGGIIGAFAGGVPAWLLARRESTEILKRDGARRISEQKAEMFSVAVKLIEIANSLVSLDGHVRGCLALKERDEFKQMESWQVLIPMVGFSDEIHIRFLPSEMAVLVANNEIDLMQDIMLLANRHAASISSFLTYNKMRAEFFAVGPKPTSFNGAIGSTLLTTAENEALKAYTIPLNNLADALSEGLVEDIELARSVTDKFGPATQKIFGVEKFADLSFPSDEELIKMRKDIAPKRRLDDL